MDSYVFGEQGVLFGEWCARKCKITREESEVMFENEEFKIVLRGECHACRNIPDEKEIDGAWRLRPLNVSKEGNGTIKSRNLIKNRLVCPAENHKKKFSPLGITMIKVFTKIEGQFRVKLISECYGCELKCEEDTLPPTYYKENVWQFLLSKPCKCREPKVKTHELKLDFCRDRLVELMSGLGIGDGKSCLICLSRTDRQEDIIECFNKRCNIKYHKTCFIKWLSHAGGSLVDKGRCLGCFSPIPMEIDESQNRYLFVLGLRPKHAYMAALLPGFQNILFRRCAAKKPGLRANGLFAVVQFRDRKSAKAGLLALSKEIVNERNLTVDFQNNYLRSERKFAKEFPDSI